MREAVDLMREAAAAAEHSEGGCRRRGETKAAEWYAGHAARLRHAASQLESATADGDE
jgi:hypothetical protein